MHGFEVHATRHDYHSIVSSTTAEMQQRNRYYCQRNNFLHSSLHSSNERSNYAKFTPIFINLQKMTGMNENNKIAFITELLAIYKRMHERHIVNIKTEDIMIIPGRSILINVDESNSICADNTITNDFNDNAIEQIMKICSDAMANNDSE